MAYETGAWGGTATTTPANWDTTPRYEYFQTPLQTQQQMALLRQRQQQQMIAQYLLQQQQQQQIPILQTPATPYRPSSLIPPVSKRVGEPLPDIQAQLDRSTELKAQLEKQRQVIAKEKEGTLAFKQYYATIEQARAKQTYAAGLEPTLPITGGGGQPQGPATPSLAELAQMKLAEKERSRPKIVVPYSREYSEKYLGLPPLTRQEKAREREAELKQKGFTEQQAVSAMMDEDKLKAMRNEVKKMRDIRGNNPPSQREIDLDKEASDLDKKIMGATAMGGMSRKFKTGVEMLKRVSEQAEGKAKYISIPADSPEAEFYRKQKLAQSQPSKWQTSAGEYRPVKIPEINLQPKALEIRGKASKSAVAKAVIRGVVKGAATEALPLYVAGKVQAEAERQRQADEEAMFGKTRWTEDEVRKEIKRLKAIY